jgi:hypothetical protein
MELEGLGARRARGVLLSALLAAALFASFAAGRLTTPAHGNPAVDGGRTQTVDMRSAPAHHAGVVKQG